VNATERFTELVTGPEERLPLDEAALLVAAHDHPVDVNGELERLDALARDAPGDTGALARHLFVERGFAGNSVDYSDPRNSFLDEVMRRRLGLPITLSVLMIEVGRRRGLALAGVGMPGHFLVRGAPGEFFDPFHGGEPLDEAGCRARFAATQGAAEFEPEYLEPVGANAILARMLANLVRTYVERSPADAVWALRLRLLVPGVSPGERRQAARLLATLGRFEEAAAALETLAPLLPDADEADARRDARRLRARSN